MKKYISDRTKILLLLLQLLAFTAMFFGSIVWLINIYTVWGEILFWISHAGVWASIIIINMKTNNYKWKYLILGKKFQEEVNHFFKNHKGFSKKEKRKLLISMKDMYRKTGSIHNSIYTHTNSPYKNWKEDNYAFNYDNSLDKQKISYLIFALNEFISSENILCDFFDYISVEPFTYEEYSLLIKNCNFLSENLKNTLISTESCKIFNLYKNFEYTEDNINTLNLYKENTKNILADFVSEIKIAGEKICFDEFISLMKMANLPKNTKVVFFSNDSLKRICIYNDEMTKTYKFSEMELMFYDIDKPQIHSDANWETINNSSSYFSSIDLVLNEIQDKIKGFTRFDL